MPEARTHSVEITPVDFIAAEGSFYKGEKLRQMGGFNYLIRLLELRDANLQQILGLRELPAAFNFESDWWKPTATHKFEARISGPNNTLLEVAGVRIQNNLLDRFGKALKHGWRLLVGGGTRVRFVPGELVEEKDAHGKSVNVWQIAKRAEKIAEMEEEGGALAAAMGPKNTGLLFTEHLINILTKMGRKDLIPKVKRIQIGGGAKADVIIALPSDFIIPPPPDVANLPLEVAELILSHYKDKVALSSQLIGKEKIDLTAQALFQLGYQLGLRGGAIGPLIDRLAGDVGTTGTLGDRPVIQWIADGYAHALYEMARKIGRNVDLEWAYSVVSGKLVGGLAARADATGLGTWEALKAYAKAKNINLVGKKVFFRGCGSAAHQAIKSAAEADMKVTGIATTTAVLVCDTGFTQEDADELYNISVEEQGNIADFARKHPDRIRIYFEADQAKEKKARAADIDKKIQELWQDTRPEWQEAARPEVIFESAAQMTINENSAINVPDGAIIVEGGNGVTTPLAARILKGKNVVTIPGILANAAGVFVSWFEWAQAILGVQFDPELVEQEVHDLMENNINVTLNLQNLAAEYGINISIEDAYYALAMARGLQAKQKIEETTRAQELVSSLKILAYALIGLPSRLRRQPIN